MKLLRVLESRNFFRVGGTQPIKVDVRVIAATNRPLRDARRRWASSATTSTTGSTSSTSTSPPLRERREDIPLLVRRFIREFAKAHDRQFRGITAEAMQRLVSAPWPGNVRQLRNLIESMVVLAPGRRDPGQRHPARRAGGRRAPCSPMRVARGAVGAAGQRRSVGQELEFILRSLVDLRLQIEELRRRIDSGPQRVQVIELATTRRR